ncbi:MAG: hypothetical protein QOD99_41 [Chthoniobacter sp.]|nr:hypothetical protein [Chthoniobacter sp.]
MATQRTTDVILETGCLNGRNVIDLGCGDGFFTIRFWDAAKPKTMLGIDGAASAIDVAKKSCGARAIRFEVGNAHQLPLPDDSFDVALVQSVLHHDDDPQGIIREAFRLARAVVIHEPNGNNPFLKVIEKASPYHREHHETSYTTTQMTRWIERAGGSVIQKRFAGFVAMFCPDWIARIMKLFEPVIERVPKLNAFGCAVYVIVARRAL